MLEKWKIPGEKDTVCSLSLSVTINTSSGGLLTANVRFIFDLCGKKCL